jgi:hypothetical protein
MVRSDAIAPSAEHEPFIRCDIGPRSLRKTLYHPAIQVCKRAADFLLIREIFNLCLKFIRETVKQIPSLLIQFIEHFTMYSIM